MHLWNQEFVSSSPEGRRYERLADDIDRALQFMAACGIDLSAERRLHEVDVFTSHEGLLLDYEEGLTRRDSLTGDWYDCSAHLLWIGERTRQLDGAHVEFFSGVHNPIAVKLGPTATPDEVAGLCERLNPDRLPGRLTFVRADGRDERRGAAAAAPPRGRGRRAPGALGVRPDAREHDPHGRRRQDAALRRGDGGDRGLLQRVLGGRAYWPGGVHLEFTGQDVTECLGGADDVLEEHLSARYETLCDPRLNARQSLDLAFRLAELMQRAPR